MEQRTRLLFNKLHTAIAVQNNVSSALTKFTVEPTIEQQLEKKIQETSGFLSRINLKGVGKLKGQKIGIGSSGPIANRTDTSGGATRKTKSLADLSSNDYECHKTDFDSHITYDQLDNWAHDPKFASIVSGLVLEQIGNDRMMIGWHGTSVAADHDPAKVMLEDMNIGWIEQQRIAKPETVIDGFKVGDQAGNDFKNIDAAVFDLINSSIEPWHQDTAGLVVITGRNLVSQKYLTLINEFNAPTERAAMDELINKNLIGGKPAISIPHFPANALVVTKLSNLSIYFQRGSTRRHLKDVPESDRIEDYRSVNECYVIEDHDCFAALTGIQVPDGAGAWV